MTILLARATTSDAATISATGVDGDYPITNALNSAPRSVVKASGSTVSVSVDLGQSTASPETYPNINIVGCLYNNASASATWRVRGADADADFDSSPEAQGYDSGTVSMWNETSYSEWTRRHTLHLPATAQSYRFWRIDFTDAGGTLQFGRLILDAAYQTARDADLGLKLGWQDSGGSVDTEGTRYLLTGKRRRVLTFKFSARNETEAFDLFDFDRLVGGSGDVFALLANTRIMERGIYGYIDELNTLDIGTHNPGLGTNLHAKQYTIVENEAP